MLRMMLAVGAALILLGSIAAAQTRTAVKACATDIEFSVRQIPTWQ